MTPCLTIGPKVKMANKMKAMREHLKKITRQHKDFRFKEDSKSNIQQHNDIRETSSHKEALIVGRTREKHILMDYLSESMKQKLTILPIYGIGGVGKTTMANSIFNDAQFEDYSRVWIYVSQAFNLNEIGNSIISQLSKEEKHITEKEIQYNRLQELLNVADKKTMIVLDDLWEEKESQLEELKAMLNVSESGKVIVIVTTRDEAIARKFCTIQPYKLPPLEDEMCWAIIKQKSSFDARNDKEKLKHIGKDIAIKCGGVALAAQTLGYMLKDMTFGEWQAVRSSDIWNVPSSVDESSLHHNVLSCLLLSYKNMPKHLKLCFAYCAVFPKGQKIIKDDLIYQWIAHDFIAPSSIFSTRLVSENYIKQLLGMSFLQHADSYLTNELNTKDVRLFTMHDLVHDLARSVMADEIFDDSKIRIIGGPNHCRYAMFSDCSKPLKLNVTCPIKIRSLRFLGCERIGLRSSAFSSAKCLRVLDLSGCSIPKLPCSIAELKQLRYLNAPRVQDQVIPKCITKLFKLSYLTLHESRIKELPDSIGEMECLMYLNLSYCTRLKKLPKSFVELKRLVHLDLSRCVCLKLKPGLLMGLNKLVHLDLSDISFADDIIGQAFGGLTELQYLNLTGLISDEPQLSGLHEVISNLTELRYLGLRKSMRFLSGKLQTDNISRFIERVSTLPNLEHLDLSSCYSIVSVPESIGSLKKLHTLNLSGCHHLESLPKSMVQMESLVILNVAGCNKLNMSTLPQSKYFWSLPHFVIIPANEVKSSSNLHLLQHQNPE